MSAAPTTFHQLVAAMIKAGANTEVIALVSEYVAASEAKSERARSANAVRQARFRERVKVGNNVTSNAENNVTVTLVSPQENKSTPLPNSSLRSELINPPLSPPPKSRRGKTGKTIIPDDWSPSPVLTMLGVTLGLTEAQIATEAEKMRDWSKANNSAKADWDATFRSWLRTASERRQSHGPPRHAAPHRKSFSDLAREEMDRERFASNPDPHNACDEAIGFNGPVGGPSVQRHSPGGQGPLLDLRPAGPYSG